MVDIMKSIVNEIKYIISSPWRVVLFLVMPPLITVYFGVVFQAGIIEHARTVLVDQDGSSLSRSLIQEFAENRGFDIVGWSDSPKGAVAWIHEEKADFAVAVPSDFARDLNSGKSPAVLLIADASNMAISSNALKRAGKLVLNFNAVVEIKALETKGFLPSQAENIALPLKMSFRQLVNPTGSFFDFLLWGMIGAVCHFPMMMFSVVSLNSKNEELAGFTEMGIKIAAYSILGMGELLFSILLAVLFFPLIFNGSVFALILLTLIFVLTVVSMGVFLSVVAPNPLIASQAGMVVVLPALLLSGHTWPMSGFPWFVRILGQMEPLTYYADPLRSLALTGRTEREYWFGVGVLALMFTGYSLATIIICQLRKKVHRWKTEALAG